MPYVAISWNEIWASGGWYHKHGLVKQTQKDMNLVLPRGLKMLEEKVDISITQYKAKHVTDSDNICSKLWIDSLRGYIIHNDDTRYVGRVTVESMKGDTDKTIIQVYKHLK